MNEDSLGFLHRIRCPKCPMVLATATCSYCKGERTVPACPPIGETVVVWHPDMGKKPLIVTKAWRAEHSVTGDITVLVTGHILDARAGAVFVQEVKGPAQKSGHWDWKGMPH